MFKLITVLATLICLILPVSSQAETILPVLFKAQVPPGNWSDTANCGQASVNMAIAYHQGVTPTAQGIVVKKVQLYVNNRLYSTVNCDAQSYDASFRWAIRYLWGAYSLQAKATDGTGKVGASPVVRVTVR